MSTKPTDTGRFAVDGSDVDAVHITPPASGLRDTGWPLNAVPTSGNFNYLENIGYRWRQYLSDGDLELNNVTVAGTLDIDGALTIDGLLTANLGISIPTGQSVVLAGSATLSVGGTSTFTGLLTANGGIAVPTAKTVVLAGSTTLTVGGLVTASTGILVPTAQTVTLAGTSTLTAGGLITANSGLTAAINQGIAISGSANYSHSTKTQSRIFYVASELVNVGGTVLTSPSVGGHYGVTLSVNSNVIVPLPVLPTHNRINTIRLAFDNATSAINVSAVAVVTTVDLPLVGGIASHPDGWSAVASTSFFSIPGSATWDLIGTSLQHTGSGTYALQVIMTAVGASKLMAVIVGYDAPP